MVVPQGRPSVTYLPGRWVALAAEDVWLLAELDPASPVLAGCWETIERGGGVDGLLGVILREGLRSVPSFALVGRTPTGLRLLVSGKAQAEVSAPGQAEPTVVGAAGAPTWIEQRLEGSPDVRLIADGGVASGHGVALPLSGGAVLASLVAVGTFASFVPTDAPVPAVVANAPAGPEPAPAPAGPEAAPSPAFAPPVVGVAKDPTLDAPLFSPDTQGSVAEPAGGSADAPADAPADVPAEAPPSFDHLFGRTDNPPEPTAAAPAEAPSPAPSSDTMQPRPQDDSGLIESLPWRLPEAFRLEGGAEPPAPSAAPAGPASAAPAGAAPAVPSPAAAAPQRPGAPDAPVRPGAPESTSMSPSPFAPFAPPSGPPDPVGPPVAGPPPEGAPVGNNTVDRSSLPPQDVPAAPTVHAVSCPNQHLNPPYASTCRVCGAPVQQQDAISVPRPTLGILNLSTGDMVPLDRDVVLGRAPFHVDTNAQSRPHLVQLASPGNDISRSHLRVSLEGWHVQVTDLGSTNGTVVILPGQPPVRLRAHDPFTIVAGTTINIADEVNVRYEIPT